MLVDYAKKELELAGLFDTDSDYNGELGKAALELVERFADQGHSGMSASMLTQIVTKLMQYQPLTPLTGEDDEWMEVSYPFDDKGALNGDFIVLSLDDSSVYIYKPDKFIHVFDKVKTDEKDVPDV